MKNMNKYANNSNNIHMFSYRATVSVSVRHTHFLTSLTKLREKSSQSEAPVPLS